MGRFEDRAATPSYEPIAPAVIFASQPAIGIKLSGGQRQRIGIARALYHEPSMLVFDEATSALDPSTEAQVMEAIYKLDGEQTILLVSHRLSTVRRADNILMLGDGQKVGEGTYDELIEEHSQFRSMALS